MCVFLSRCKNDSFRLSLFIVTRITSPMMDERDAFLDATTGDRPVQSVSSRSVCRFNEPTEGRASIFARSESHNRFLVSLIIYSCTHDQQYKALLIKCRQNQWARWGEDGELEANKQRFVLKVFFLHWISL